MTHNSHIHHALPYFFCCMNEQCDIVNKLHISADWYTISVDILYEIQRFPDHDDGIKRDKSPLFLTRYLETFFPPIYTDWRG